MYSYFQSEAEIRVLVEFKISDADIKSYIFRCVHAISFDTSFEFYNLGRKMTIKGGTSRKQQFECTIR